MRARRTDTRQASQRHFDRWSRRYEADRRSRRLAPLQDEALRALDLRPGDALLDVGCGSGAAVRRAAAVAERAVGVDASPGMLARANELAAAVPNVQFVAADAGRLPFADASFTAVMSTTAFHHFPEPERATAEMGRVLAAGGRLALGDATADRRTVRVADRVLRAFQRGHVGFYRSDELVALLNAAGLDVVDRRPMWDGAYLILVARKR